ncbi:MAG: choline-sulfatase [Planctomycetota bacterium]|jgi:choline-sulfatase
MPIRRSSFSLPLVLAALLASCSSNDAPTPGPNVVLLVIDTLRADRLPFYGHDRQTAPFLDSLASRGAVFERAWSTSSWTAPSTASIFTGLYPNQHGLTQGMKLVQSVQRDKAPTLTLNRIPDAIETLPELMRSRGYRTFGIADNPNICAEEGFDAGFDRFQNYDLKDAPVVNETLAGWAEEIRASPHWFVFFQYTDPHFPYQERAPWFEHPNKRRKENRDKTAREKSISNLYAVYDSEINYADDHIRQAFELIGVDDQTVIIMVADHGEELLQRSDDYQHEFKLYSELVHVPLFIVDPTAQQVRPRVPHTVSIIDILPTIRQIIGAPASRIDFGRSLVSYYADTAEIPDDRTVYSMRERLEILGGQKKWAVIQQADKLIVNENERGTIPELYDLNADWGELNNLAETQIDRVEELSAKLEAFRSLENVYDAVQIEKTLTEAEAANLDNIGYGGGHDDPNEDEEDGQEKDE